MTERPILFNATMVRAVLAGTKTQTRRVVKPQFAKEAAPVEMPATDPIGGWVVGGHSGIWWCDAAANPDEAMRCPYGKPGDRLWVREAWARNANQLSDSHMDTSLVYRADDKGRALDNGTEKPWTPSIHMPRWASRITLEVTGVRVERLQDISDDDAQSEGVSPSGDNWGAHKSAYERLWESINGPGSWDLNPWVWVVEFRRLPTNQRESA